MAGAEGAAVSCAVVLERPAVAVGGVAVGFDDQPRLRPGGGDLVAGEFDADRRAGDPVAPAEGEQVVFEVGPRALRRFPRQCQHAGAAAARIAFNYCLQGGQVEVAAVLGLVDGALERLGWQDVGEVEQGAGDGGDRDVVPNDVSSAASRPDRCTRMALCFARPARTGTVSSPPYPAPTPLR
jgi:hypothetical protein